MHLPVCISQLTRRVSSPISSLVYIKSYRTMANPKAFLDKVLALRPDLAGGNDEKEKVLVSTLAAEAPNLASDIQVRPSYFNEATWPAMLKGLGAQPDWLLSAGS
jgi:hypothetical protein